MWPLASFALGLWHGRKSWQVAQILIISLFNLLMGGKSKWHIVFYLLLTAHLLLRYKNTSWGFLMLLKYSDIVHSCYLCSCKVDFKVRVGFCAPKKKSTNHSDIFRKYVYTRSMKFMYVLIYMTQESKTQVTDQWTMSCIVCDQMRCWKINTYYYIYVCKIYITIYIYIYYKTWESLEIFFSIPFWLTIF